MPPLKLQSASFVVALFAMSLSSPTIEAARADASAPFAGLSGKWSGEGSIALTNGNTERLRCDATYTVSGGGDTLDQALHCKSDSYNFDLRTNLVDSGGQILGSWNEVSKGVSGGIAGHDSKGIIQVNANGQAFSAAVTVVTHGSEQSVKIRSGSGDLSQVTITLHRAR